MGSSVITPGSVRTDLNTQLLLSMEKLKRSATEVECKQFVSKIKVSFLVVKDAGKHCTT